MDRIVHQFTIDGKEKSAYRLKTSQKWQCML